MIDDTFNRSDSVDPDATVRQSRSSAAGEGAAVGDDVTRAMSTPGASETVAFVAANPGEIIGNYRLVSVLGRGGQGVVYRAQDLRLGRDVALKVLSMSSAISPDGFLRFEREAELAAKIDHPGVCGIYDAGVSFGRRFIAMRLVEGEPLSKLIGAWREKIGTEPLPVKPSGDGYHPSDTRFVVRFFAEAARALNVIHEAGIVHRDVKPGNLMVTTRGRPVVMDLGLAREADAAGSDLTMSGDVFGTPLYMAPEQLREGAAAADRRSDVWSLGVALYEALTLSRPFAAPTTQGIQTAILETEPESARRRNPAISRDLDVVIATALTKERSRRYQSAAALADDLESVLDGRPIAARPLGAIGRFLRWTRRRPAKAALLLTLIVTIPTIALLIGRHLATEPERARARAFAAAVAKDELLARAFYELACSESEIAEEHFRDVLEQDPRSPEAAAGIVMAQQESRLWEKSRATLTGFSDLLSGTAAEELLARRAAAAGRRIVGDKPSSAAAFRGPFDHFLFAVAKFEEAEDCFEGDPDRPRKFREAWHHVMIAVMSSGSPRLLFYIAAARIAGRLDEKTAAVETAVALETLWKNSAPARFWGAWTLENGAKDPDRAIEAYRRTLELDGSFRAAHTGIALCLEQKGKTAEAEATLRRAMILHPDWASPYYFLGNLMRRQGRLDEAVKALEEAASRTAGLHIIWTNLGGVYLETGRIAEAVAANLRAVEEETFDPVAWYNLGVSLDRAGYVVEATTAFETAVAIHPLSAAAHVNLGTGLIDDGFLDAGRAAIMRGIEIDPNFAGAYVVLASKLSRAGFPRDAMKLLETVRARGLTSGFLETVEKRTAAAVELEDEVARAIADQKKPETATDMIRWATFLLKSDRPWAAVRLFEEAFEVDDDLIEADGGGYAVRAARAMMAAAAGFGDAKDVPETERKKLRAKAKAHITEVLELWRDRDELRPTGADAVKFAHELRTLANSVKNAPEIAVLRGDDSLTNGTIEERGGWTTLRDDIDRFIENVTIHAPNAERINAAAARVGAVYGRMNGR